MTTASTGKVPLIRNPLFPLVAAVWCAALFGLGSLALGSTSLENIVLGLRLDRVIPAAAPPLGFTARLLFALLLAVAGSVLGLGVGLALRRRPADAGANEPTPFTPDAEYADEGEDLARLEAARENRPPRRRALTTDLSDGEPGVLKVAELDVLAPLEPETAREPIAPAPQADAAPVATLAESPASGPAPAPAAEAPPQRRFGRPAPAAATAAEPAPAAAVAAAPSSPLEALPVDQLIERLARALAGRSARSAPAVAPPVQPTAAAEPAPPASRVEAAPVPAPAPAPAPAIRAEAPAQFRAEPSAPADRPFDMPASMRGPSVGDIDWFQPSDAEIAREDEALASLLPPRRAEPAAPAPAPAAIVAAEPAPQPEPARPSAPAPAPMPTSSAPLMPGDVELWNLPELTGEESEEEIPQDPGFSSLLDIQPAARVAESAAPQTAPFVRIETDHVEDGQGLAEPVVVFPGQTAPRSPAPARLSGAPGLAQPTSPVQTEAALREALAALQKMSGNG